MDKCYTEIKLLENCQAVNRVIEKRLNEVIYENCLILVTLAYKLVQLMFHKMYKLNFEYESIIDLELALASEQITKS